MKVIIAGSRRLPAGTNYFYLVAQSVRESGFEVSEVVSGTAIGIDRAGEVWAWDNGIPVKRFKPDWAELGKVAGIIRNCDMADYAEALIAIWDGKSKGTKHMIEHMRGQGKKVYVKEI